MRPVRHSLQFLVSPVSISNYYTRDEMVYSLINAISPLFHFCMKSAPWLTGNYPNHFRHSAHHFSSPGGPKLVLIQSVAA